MKRDIQTLGKKQYDVLILGAGIHGAAVASACAQAGLATALIEKNDFGHATSANSLKILHGGLRYLQHLNIKRMRDSIVSRRSMLAKAPHVARPLRCLIPNHGKGLHSNFLMRIALFVNDLIGYDRNSGVAAANSLSRGEVISRSRLLAMFPDIVKEEITGASIWCDAIAVNSERLTLSLVQEAAINGASVANYIEAMELLPSREGGRSVRVRDCLTGERFSIHAKCVVNSCGPWGESVLGENKAGASSPTSWAKAVNIVVKKSLFPGYAVGLTGETEFADKDSVLKKKGRFFFFVPWRGYTMIGTTYKSYSGSPDDVRADADDVGEILRLINDIYPQAGLEKSDVTFAHAGLVPMSEGMSESASEVQLEKESLIIDHGTERPEMAGVYSIKGVKYTTAPKVATELNKKICNFLQVPAFTLQETGLPDHGLQKQGSTDIPSSMSYLVSRYGKASSVVLSYIENSDKLLSEVPVFRLGEVAYMVEEEMACKLSDVVLRRCGLATAELPAHSVLAEIAEYMGDLLHWDAVRQDKEIQEVFAVFSSWQ